MKISEWKEHIGKERQAKNRFFILDPRSPVLAKSVEARGMGGVHVNIVSARAGGEIVE